MAVVGAFASDRIILPFAAGGQTRLAALSDVGEGFIQCHHTKPLYEVTGAAQTRLEDLALVCSNWHRIVHRKRPWLSVAAFVKLCGSSFRTHDLTPKRICESAAFVSLRNVSKSSGGPGGLLIDWT